MAYEADVEAHMDEFEDMGSCHDARRQSMVELGLCYDVMRQDICCDGTGHEDVPSTGHDDVQSYNSVMRSGLGWIMVSLRGA